MKTDSRGRVRFTHNGTRYEINKEGVLRAYARDIAGPGTERAKVVTVNGLDAFGRIALREAVMVARGERTFA